MTEPESSLVEKIPPQSVEAEQATLGSMLLERDAIARVVDLLDPEDFYRQGHRLIYSAIINLFEKSEPVDLVTLGEYLRTHEQLESVGGMAYLTALLDIVPTAANVERYAKIVRTKSVLRNLISAAHQITRLAYESSEDVEMTVDECERLIFSVAEQTVTQAFIPLKQLLTQAFDQIEDMQRTRSPGTGIHTGYREFDSLTSGLQPSDLVVIAGRPSMGKTAFALNVATRVALNEKLPVALFSLEMAKEQLAQRLVCSEARVDLTNLRQGFLEEEELARIVRAVEILYEAPIYIDDSASMSVLELRGKARRLMAEHGLGLIIVDYLQLMHGHGRFENRNQEISQIARSLKSLGRELKVPVMALSQLSRAVETRGGVKRPMLSDLRESGSIEQEADVVAFIYRPAQYGTEELQRAGYTSEDANVAEIDIAKQRNGPTDRVKLAWIAQYTRFEDLTEAYGRGDVEV